MFGNCLEQVRLKSPVIHNITNYVTVNDVANIELACGASPIMADEEQEMDEITVICHGLNINMGTLSMRTIPAMERAGKRAKELSHPVLLDPVGVGVSHLRMETARRLMDTIGFDVIRGNISEIKSLVKGSKGTRGVDADRADAITEASLEEAVWLVKEFARAHHTIAAVTGKVDFVSDGNRCYLIRNGRQEMEQVTGAGCQLSGLTTAYMTANQEHMLEAVAAATCAMGLAGEIAWERMQPGDGNATYRNRMIDAIYQMDRETLERGAKYELR